MSTATLPRIFDLPPDERRAAYDAAAARVAEASREASASFKAREPDPRSVHDYRIYNTMRMVCILVVKHRDRVNSIEVSRDGGGAPHAFIDPKKMIVQPESEGEFVLALVGRGLSQWIYEKQRVNLLAITPPLADGIEWTDEQRKTWTRLETLRSSINSKIYFAKKRPASVLSRSAVA